MRILLVLVALAACAAGCGGAPTAGDRLTELPGVRDARVSEEEIDDGETATTATVDMEPDATEPQIAAALGALGNVDASFRDLLVGAGSVERPSDADGPVGIYKVDFDERPSPTAATLARWFVAGTGALPDAQVSVGLNDVLEVDLGAVGTDPVAAAAVRLRALPRLRDLASVHVSSGTDDAGPGAELRTDRGLRDGRMVSRLRALTRIAAGDEAAVTRVAVSDGRGDGTWLTVDLDVGEVDPDSITVQRFGAELAPLLRDLLELLRPLPAGSRLRLDGAASHTTFLDVAARPRPGGGETYGDPGWNEVALRLLRAGG